MQTAGRGKGSARRRRSREQWAAEVSRWRTSGEDAEAYAKAYGLSPVTLRWWASRLGMGRTARGAVAQSARAARDASSPVTFLPVAVTPAPGPPSPLTATPPTSGISLVTSLRDGRSVRVEGCVAEVARFFTELEGGLAC